MSSAVSPLAPTNVPDMPEIAGVRLATAEAGIRYKGRTDVLLAVMDKGTAVAGVFTRSKCPSAPVEWCRGKLKGGKARALVVNSGNANAFTGKSGKQSTALVKTNPDAEAQWRAYVHFLMSPDGRAAYTLINAATTSVGIILFSAIGGALGVRLLAPRKTPLGNG